MSAFRRCDGCGEEKMPLDHWVSMSAHWLKVIGSPTSTARTTVSLDKRLDFCDWKCLEVWAVCQREDAA